MNLPVAAPEPHSLPDLVSRASRALAAAQTAAEVLEARDAAAFAYDTAKAAARFARAKGAHDELIAAAHRAQADAVDIEEGAKRRLADEYDQAQDRGEVQRAGGDRTSIVPDRNNAPTVTDLGLTRKQVHEARAVRNAEALDPGIVRRTLDERLAAGAEPTKAAVRAAVDNVINIGKRLTPIEPADQIERGLLAEEYGSDFLGAKDFDANSVKDRARAINGALNTFDFVAITAQEYWSVYGHSPERATFSKWVRAAKKKIDDIAAGLDEPLRSGDGSGEERHG